MIGSGFDDVIDGNSKDNHLVGAGGNDIIHGHMGNDRIEGNGGDDDLFGDEGDDQISGGTGNDVALGDVGIVKHMPDGSKQILLLDTAKLLADRTINGSSAINASLLGDEMWLVAGVQDSKGKWTTHLLSLDLYAAGNDTILGNEGDDLLFGQRGNDTIYGGAGNDYIEGNEGNDTLYGDREPGNGGGGTLTAGVKKTDGGSGAEGDDIIIGDNSFNFAATSDHLPLVLHGYELNPEVGLPNGKVPARGAMVIPMATLMPYGVQQIQPFGAALYHGAGDLSAWSGLTPYKDASGRVMTFFASVIPDVERHVDLVAGNDVLFGDGGNDRLIGDNNAVLAPFQINLNSMLGDFEHAMSRLGWIDQMLPPHPVNVVSVASDYLDGGTGDDYVIGDSNLMLIGSATTTGNLTAGLEQAADDFDNGVEAFAKTVKGKPVPLGFTTSRDTLLGNDGNDVLIGDSNVAVGLVAEGPTGSAASVWLSKVKLPSLAVIGAQDALDGGAGNDLVIGDARVDVLAGVGANPFVSLPRGALGASADELAPTGFVLGETGAPAASNPFTPVLAAVAGTGTGGFHTVEVNHMLDTLTLVGAQDVLSGGDDNDTVVGDNSLTVAAQVVGPFVTLNTGVAYPDRQLVRVNSLVGSVNLQGSEDDLSGGGGDDVLIGDHDLTVAGVFQGPVLVVGAGQGITRAKITKIDDELVSFDGLVDCIQASGTADVLNGGDGGDLLIGDTRSTVTGLVLGTVIAGSSAATGYTVERHFETPVEFTQLVGSLNLSAGGDLLSGGEGNDELIGDNSMTIAGIVRGSALTGPAAFMAQAAYTNPFWEALVDFDGLVGSVSSSGGSDELLGEGGDDTLVGDDQIVVAAVSDGDLLAVGSGNAALPTKKLYDSALVEFDQLVGNISTCAATDTLDGGAGNDLAVGDDRLLVAGVQTGSVIRGDAAFVSDAAAAAGRLSTEAQVDFDNLVNCIELGAASDTLTGGDGDDVLIGDHQAAIIGAVAGPVLEADSTNGQTATNAPKAVTQSEALVDFDNLVGSLHLHAGKDALSGDLGNDTLIGDNDLLVAGIVSGALATGFQPVITPTSSTTTASSSPTQVSLVEFDSLVGCLDLDACRDSLDGGAGDDRLTGDNALSVFAIVAGGADVGSQPAKLALRIEFERLLDDVDVGADSDALLGGDGNDCLIGDSEVDVTTLITGAQPGDGVRVQVDALAGKLDVHAASDRLEGGAGDDHLIGDNEVALTGVTLASGGLLGTRTIEVESLLCNLDVDGSCDTLLGGDNNDVLIGDNAISFTGVELSAVQAVVPPTETIVATAATTTTVAPSSAVKVDSLVGSADIGAGSDTLDGGAGDDVLYGDQHVSLAGVTGSPVTGESLTIAIDSLASCMNVDACGDKLTGGLGNDQLVGDSRLEAAAVVGGMSPGTTMTVAVKSLAGNVYVGGDRDQMYGNDGDDLLVGDNQAVIAGLVLQAAVNGDLTVSVDGLMSCFTLDAGCGGDSLDGGTGNDTLIGDQAIAVGAVLNAGAVSSTTPSGNVALTIHQLVDGLKADAGDDCLTGGTGDDLMLGDSQTVVAAYLGSFAVPIAAGVKVTGDRLVNSIGVDAGYDTQRGGDGNDTLIGDSDTTAALLGNGGVAPAGTFGMTRLAERLNVSARSDDLKGEAGTNVTEQGNRAATTLVKSVNISALFQTNPPAAAPVIDWQGEICGDGSGSGGERRDWLGDFVNGLGQSDNDRNPNAKIRIKL